MSRIAKFLALFLFRLINSLMIRTFYVPDEYWQSLEVAHHLVFGYGHLTWEWENRIRGFFHPLLFALPFKLLEITGNDSRQMVILAPKILQSFLVAVGDMFFYRFAIRLVGLGGAKFALFCYLTNHFCLFSLTRTLSNSLETVLTVVGFAYYPWEMYVSENKASVKQNRIHKQNFFYLVMAATSVILRPTSVITWAPLWMWHLTSKLKGKQERVHLLLMTIGVAVVALIFSISIDSYFYGRLTFVPWEFVKFNVMNGISSFYGSHPFHWYLTQGFPVILGPHIFPFILGLYFSLKKQPQSFVFPHFLLIWILFVYSLLSHKEFRFISTLLPVTMCYVGFFLHEMDSLLEGSRRAHGIWSKKKTFLVSLTTVGNIMSFVYLSSFHQRGNMDVMTYLGNAADDLNSEDMSVLFLLPCHQHPYYSHIHRDIPMRFLHCEPNIDKREEYVEEADAFFDDSLKWLTTFLKNGSESIPTHVIVSEKTVAAVGPVLRDEVGLKMCESFFHAHISLDSRMGKEIFLYCKN